MPTLNIICFVEKNDIFLRFCLYFMRETLLKVIALSRFLGKMIRYLNFIYRLLVYLTSFTVFSGDIKKKALKMTS